MRADRLAERLGIARAVDQERDREPDALVQGPRRVRRARSCAWSSGSRPWPVRPPATSRTRSPRTPPLPGCRRTSSSPPTSRRRRSSRPAPTARTSSRSAATTTPSTASAPSCRASAPWAFVNVNVRPVLRRGLQDARVRDRRAARLGAARPRGRADRLRLAVHQGRARLRGVHRRRAAQRRGPDDVRRPGRGLLAGRAGVRRRHRRLPPGQAGHDRQVAGDRQPGRRPVRGRAGERAPAA